MSELFGSNCWLYFYGGSHILALCLCHCLKGYGLLYIILNLLDRCLCWLHVGELFLPNVHFSDFIFLIVCGSAVRRVYSELVLGCTFRFLNNPMLLIANCTILVALFVTQFFLQSFGFVYFLLITGKRQTWLKDHLLHFILFVLCDTVLSSIFLPFSCLSGLQLYC